MKKFLIFVFGLMATISVFAKTAIPIRFEVVDVIKLDQGYDYIVTLKNIDDRCDKEFILRTFQSVLPSMVWLNKRVTIYNPVIIASSYNNKIKFIVPEDKVPQEYMDQSERYVCHK